METIAENKVAASRPDNIGYVDRLRVIMTVLVIFHHTAITYGGPGGWYMSDAATQGSFRIALTWFVATNQSFFMGFFFFLSALFTPAAFDRKGPGRFLSDRLMRLGIPLVVYSFVISPVTIWLVQKYQRKVPYSFTGFISGFDDWIDFGVLWFVAALLLFTFLYLTLRLAGFRIHRNISLPRRWRIVLFALGIGVISFTVRIIFPIGWVLKPLGFQPAHFPQYIALYALGLTAARNKWLANFPLMDNRFWICLSSLLVFIGFPSLYLVKIFTVAPLTAFSGGPGLPSLVYSIWEQLTGFSVIMALTGWFKSKDRRPGQLLQGMTRAAFAVYIIHPMVLVGIAVIALRWPLTSGGKFLVVAPVAAITSFLAGSLLVRIPGANKVL